MMNLLRRPIFPYPKVLDHNGWDRKNFDYSWKEEKNHT